MYEEKESSWYNVKEKTPKKHKYAGNKQKIYKNQII